jgi:hypothetical protein
MSLGVGVIISTGQRNRAVHKGLQKSSIDVSRVCSRVCRDEEHRREFVPTAQPIDWAADAFNLIVMYIAVCCVEAFENSQV